MGIHPCLLILKPSRESATSGRKLGERSEDTSPLSTTINCGKGRKALILSSKIPWNQKVAILLRVSFSGAVESTSAYIKGVVANISFDMYPKLPAATFQCRSYCAFLECVREFAG
jgi:hypothetical protein